MSPKRSPLLAAALSIVPGLGQVYAGEWRRGLALLLGLTAQAGLLWGVKLHWLIAWLVVVWAWNIYDAHLAAQGRKLSGSVPALMLILVNLIAAWKVTDIHTPELGPQQRSVIGQIMGGLANPDIAAKRSVEQKATGKYLVPGPEAPEKVTPAEQEPGGPVLSLSPKTAREGEKIEVKGSGFAKNTPGQLVLLSADEIVVAEFKTRADGSFETNFTNPRGIPGVYFVQARVTSYAGGWQLSETLRDAGPRMLETVYMALIGTALSLVFALPLSFLAARNLMSGSPVLRAIYGLTRALFTVLRSVEVLIFAVIAVAAVGVGPFAGVIALAIHGIGAMGKLYSEAIESIEHGPIEAIRSTGANETQTVIYGVVPQVVPQFIAFTLYRWDINVRMATVIGLVGGGGIGYQLIQYMNLLQWRQAATCIWLIAGVVMVMDYASAVIREKIG
jgi:phosphonate transport system permease protein